MAEGEAEGVGIHCKCHLRKWNLRQEAQKVLGAPAGLRAQLAGSRGMGPIRWRGHIGFGPSGGPYRTTGGFYARGS